MKGRRNTLIDDPGMGRLPNCITWMPEPNGEKGRRGVFRVSPTLIGSERKARVFVHINIANDKPKRQAANEAIAKLHDMRLSPDKYISKMVENSKRRNMSKKKLLL